MATAADKLERGPCDDDWRGTPEPVCPGVRKCDPGEDTQECAPEQTGRKYPPGPGGPGCNLQSRTQALRSPCITMSSRRRLKRGLHRRVQQSLETVRCAI